MSAFWKAQQAAKCSSLVATIRATISNTLMPAFNATNWTALCSTDGAAQLSAFYAANRNAQLTAFIESKCAAVKRAQCAANRSTFDSTKHTPVGAALCPA